MRSVCDGLNVKFRRRAGGMGLLVTTYYWGLRKTVAYLDGCMEFKTWRVVITTGVVVMLALYRALVRKYFGPAKEVSVFVMWLHHISMSKRA